MHSKFSFSNTMNIYNYDHTSECAIWAIALVHYWLSHAFKVANCNGFYFNAYPLGLSPNGTLRLFMVLYDPAVLCRMSITLRIFVSSVISMPKCYISFLLLWNLYNPTYNFIMIVVLPDVIRFHSDMLLLISFLYYICIYILVKMFNIFT